MSGDLNYMQCKMVTNEFIDSLKSLSVSQSSKSYTDAIENLHNQLKLAIPNGLKENKAFAFTIVDDLYRIIPLFDRILSTHENDDPQVIQINQFLTTLINAFENICLFDVFAIVQDPNKLQIIFRNNIILLKENYFLNYQKYENLCNTLVPIVAFTSAFLPITEENLPPNLLTYLLTYTKQYWQSSSHERTIRCILGLMKIFSKKPILVPLIIRTEWPNACIEWFKR